MFTSLSPIFALYTLTPGRRIYVLRRLRKLAVEQQLEPIVAACDAGIAADRKALDLDARRLDPGAPARVRDKDLLVDQALTAIDGVLSFHAGVEQDESAINMQNLLFPSGVGHHTRLPHIEQSAANERVLAILQSEQQQQWVATYGLERLTKSLANAHAEFDAALASRDDFSPTSFAEVKAARALGQELYLEVVVQILAAFANNPDDRARLLQPIWQEEERVRAFRRQRRGGLLDVDPDSGEIIEPVVEAEPPAEADADAG